MFRTTSGSVDRQSVLMEVASQHLPLVGDGLEVPDVGHPNVRRVGGEVGLAPLERWQVVESWAGLSHELQPFEHLVPGDLHVCGAVRPVAQGTEGVCPVLGVQVAPG